MKMLVTGAAGMLGSALVPAMAEAGHAVTATDIDLSSPPMWGGGTALELLDVRVKADVDAAVANRSPDIVVHLAAETSLEVSDIDQNHAFLTNTIATKYVALACRNAHIPLVYISTAGVFDGEISRPYTEFDRPNPVNTYGASKYEGEILVREMLDEYYICRAGWMVGGGPGKDHKFVSRILQQIRGGATTIHAVGDKFGTPTYTYDFAKCLLNLIDSKVYGLYHMACEGEGSRLDVAACLLREINRPDIDLVEVDSSFFAEEFPSVRPRSEIMRNMALELQGMNLMRPWQDALHDYVSRHFSDLVAPALAASA
jgi:dTDP-4-dehydrorhamnose reductase